MSLFRTAKQIETNDSFHMGRLLVLIEAFSGENADEFVEGITKLAKLDFLLRYPSFLQRALVARGGSKDSALLRDFESDSVESMMVRYRYGPWDFRYRRFINLLVARGLVHVSVRGRTVNLSTTQKGHKVADQLRQQADFAEISRRSKLLKTHLDLSATTLMKFIYKTFPEIGDLSFGESIREF